MSDEGNTEVEVTDAVLPERDDAALRELAIARLKKKRDFRTHLFIYVAVNAVLVVIWAVTSDGGLFWPIFPILGWGIGVAANAWDVYGRRPITEDEIRREAERLRSGPPGPTDT
jgi:2TM domain